MAVPHFNYLGYWELCELQGSTLKSTEIFHLPDVRKSTVLLLEGVQSQHGSMDLERGLMGTLKITNNYDAREQLAEWPISFICFVT